MAKRLTQWSYQIQYIKNTIVQYQCKREALTPLNKFSSFGTTITTDVKTQLKSNHKHKKHETAFYDTIKMQTNKRLLLKIREKYHRVTYSLH